MPRTHSELLKTSQAMYAHIGLKIHLKMLGSIGPRIPII